MQSFSSISCFEHAYGSNTGAAQYIFEEAAPDAGDEDLQVLDHLADKQGVLQQLAARITTLIAEKVRSPSPSPPIPLPFPQLPCHFLQRKLVDENERLASDNARLLDENEALRAALEHNQ